MRVLVCFLLGLASGAVLAQPATVTGMVRDASGLPLPGANVYLSGTTHGDASDAKGRYEISGVAPGAYRLVGSMLGFEPDIHEIRLAGGDRVTVTLRLQPATVEMGAVRIEAERDVRWERRLARFTEALLGTSSNADSTRLLNPEVLEFSGSWGTLVATASAPLLIENRALGYLLRYDLSTFEASAGRVRYHGNEVFEPLAPASPEDATRWEAGRRKAYRGSLSHALRSMLAGTDEAEGFTLLHVFDGSAGAARRASFRTTGESVMDKASYGWGALRFQGRIEIAYSGEPEEAAYLRSEWFSERRRSPDAVQRSALHLNESIVKVDPQGTPEDPFALSTSGYMAFERLADRVPEDYTQEDYTPEAAGVRE